MDLSGTQRIKTSNEAVYDALNDPDVLRQCIPGCETIEKTSDTTMKARVKLKIGPMKVSFDGNVVLSDLEPPHSYRITGEGSGGVAGFAKGSAGVRLERDGDATLLHYTVHADVGGKIAQLGARLIDGTAKKLSAEFFEKLGAVIVPPAPAPPAEDEPGAAIDVKKPGWFSKTFGSASTP